MLQRANTVLGQVLTDHQNNCDNVFVVQYFGMHFGTLNEIVHGPDNFLLPVTGTNSNNTF